MTKLRGIKIEGFRGARFPLDIDFTKRNVSMAIYGDNGGGKSTITDAIEWYYNNRIDYLWREDCKEECLRNTHFPDDKDTAVSIEFSRKEVDADKTLSPQFRTKLSNTSSEFKEYLDQSKKERLLLSCRVINEFCHWLHRLSTDLQTRIAVPTSACWIAVCHAVCEPAVLP